MKAQLQIYAESRSGIGISTFAVSDNTWNESTLTYSSAPAMGAALSSSAPFAADSWVPLDVSTYVTGEGTYSFGVTTPGVTSIKLASREGGLDIAPRLILVLQAPPTSTDAPTETVAATSTQPASSTPVAPSPPAASATPTLAPPPGPSDTPISPPTLAPSDTPAAATLPPAASDTATAVSPPAASDTPTAPPTEVSTDTPQASPTPTSTETATALPAPSGRINHVFVVVMENKAYDEVWNAGSVPYISQLGNNYARATNYHAVTHPSLPNYLTLIGGSNYGITTDCEPSASCQISAGNLADNLEAVGLSWKGYMESMPAPCYLTTSGRYAPKHNPFVYFDDIRNDPTRCANHVVSYSALPGDLASSATTPNFRVHQPQPVRRHARLLDQHGRWLATEQPAADPQLSGLHIGSMCAHACLG